MTVALCIRCKRERRIEAKGLCKSCYQMSLHTPEELVRRSSQWINNNRERYNKRMREYQRVKLNIPKEKWRV